MSKWKRNRAQWNHLAAVFAAFGAVHHNVNLGVGSGTPDVARHDLDVVHNAWRVWRVWRVQLHACTIRDPGVTIHITHTVADNCPPRGTDDPIDRGASHLAETEKTISFFPLWVCRCLAQ